jgi:hypothetical protein
MKNKHFLVTVLLVLAIILANIPITVYASIFDMAHNLFEQYTNKTEEQIYAILPHAMALVEVSIGGVKQLNI